MVALVSESHHPINPLDLLEELGTANDWTLDRHSESELLIEIGGRWCSYNMFSVWQANVSSMFFSCHFDMKVPEIRRIEVCELLAQANERLWLGHFDLMAEERALMYRHTIPLRGLSGASLEQLEDLVEAALMECDRIYPALQLVVWGDSPVREALDAALLETVGEA
ncbi:MAG: YbjN domain-containing protein [Kiloniellaceae bacterium]